MGPGFGKCAKVSRGDSVDLLRQKELPSTWAVALGPSDLHGAVSLPILLLGWVLGV